MEERVICYVLEHFLFEKLYVIITSKQEKEEKIRADIKNVLIEVFGNSIIIDSDKLNFDHHKNFKEVIDK
jgi:hypothetical protein